MEIFAYGSLMHRTSLHRTAPDAEILKKVTLEGYRRVFDVPSHNRINDITGAPSAVLTIQSAPQHTVEGLLLEVPISAQDDLFEREKGYDFVEITLACGTEAKTFIRRNYPSHPYIEGDSLQREYLEYCLEAAEEYDMLDNFLETICFRDVPLRNLLKSLL